MSIAFNLGSLVATPGQILSVSHLVSTAASPDNPAFLILNGYDRAEYTVASSGATGSFGGNAHTLALSAIGGDARGAGIVFTYVAASGHYANATFGDLDQVSYTASTSSADVTDLSLFATSDAHLAQTYAARAISLSQVDAAGYLGTLTVANASNNRSDVPSQATPFSIAAVAQSFVGSTWNMDGCWTLASTIAATAGASLPVQSAVNMAGAANGEWLVAYNGPAGSSDDWASTVRTGDMIGFVTSAGTGHITTCVSGYGSTATLVDNTTFWNSSGAIVNGAMDGSSKDIVVQAAHAAAREWSGVSAKSVVIYRLDTPVVATLTATLDVSADGTANLATVFAATDSAGKAITRYQAYTASTADWLSVNGNAVSARSAASAVTVSSLSEISFNAGVGAHAEAVTVRAYNGKFWSDWTTASAPIDAASVRADMGTSDLRTGKDQVPVFRFFDKGDGTHFFTASTTEAQGLAVTRSDLSFEGIGLGGYATAAASPSSEAVFRFFDTTGGTHFYTASTSERDSLLATRSADLKFEGTAFYEDATPQPGDSAVYRFFDTAHGTHLFTQSASERASILTTRPDLVSEGIAFYAPN